MLSRDEVRSYGLVRKQVSTCAQCGNVPVFHHTHLEQQNSWEQNGTFRGHCAGGGGQGRRPDRVLVSGHVVCALRWHEQVGEAEPPPEGLPPSRSDRGAPRCARGVSAPQCGARLTERAAGTAAAQGHLPDGPGGAVSCQRHLLQSPACHCCQPESTGPWGGEHPRAAKSGLRCRQGLLNLAPLVTGPAPRTRSRSHALHAPSPPAWLPLPRSHLHTGGAPPGTLPRAALCRPPGVLEKLLGHLVHKHESMEQSGR